MTETESRKRIMSLMFTCNFCGEPIDKDMPYVTLTGNGDRSRDFWRSGYVGHYHADPTIGCWDRILEALRLCDAPRLDAIPTASYQAIAARRRKHRPLRPDDGTTPAA
jgi:hypothetical protein